MAKPKHITLKSDVDKKFSTEVFDLVRTKLTTSVGGNVNLGVKLATEHFAPRMPASVTAAEMGDAIPQIVDKFTAEQAVKPAESGRLPLNDEAQAAWDAGQWRGRLTVHGLRQRFVAEIKDGIDLTLSMVGAYAIELAAEKAKIVELVSEHDDPDSKPVACGSPVHRGDNAPFQPTVRYRLTRNDTGELVRTKHSQGDDFIQVGNFLVVPAGDEEGVDRAVPYCATCRDAAWSLGRETGTKVTFYTASGAKRKLDVMKKSSEGNTALEAQLKRAGARTFGGRYGSPKVWKSNDWRKSRGAKK